MEQPSDSPNEPPKSCDGAPKNRLDNDLPYSPHSPNDSPNTCGSAATRVSVHREMALLCLRHNSRGRLQNSEFFELSALAHMDRRHFQIYFKTISNVILTIIY